MARYCVVDDILSTVISHYYVTIFTILLEPTAKDGVRKKIKDFCLKFLFSTKERRTIVGTTVMDKSHRDIV